MADLNNTDKIEYFNQSVEEAKQNDPELSTLSPVAFGFARQYAQSITFPMGLIGFSEGPTDVDDYVKNVIQGSINISKKLKSGDPIELIGSGIDYFVGFDESKSANDFLTATKTTFQSAKDGLLEIKSLEGDGEKNIDSPFREDSPLNKMSTDEIQSLLGLTILNFVKEIGIARDNATKERDDYFFEKGQKAFEIAQGTINQTSEQNLSLEENSEYGERLAEIKKEESRVVEILSNNDFTKSIEELLKGTIPANTVTNTITEKENTVTQNIVEKSQSLVTEVAPQNSINTANPKQKSEKNASNIGLENTTKKSNETVDNLLFVELGKKLGFTDKEINEIFGGADASKISEGLKSSLKEVSPQESVTQNETKSQTINEEIQAATKMSEPIKMTESVVAPPSLPTISQQQTVSTVSGTENEAKTEVVEKLSENKSESLVETSTKQESSEKNQSNNNELLMVMKEILRTLQGPLITTDSTPKFH